MIEADNPFISRSFLRSVWAAEFEQFKDSEDEAQLLAALKSWAARTDLKETSAQSAFINVFFEECWGYEQSGKSGESTAFSLYPEFPVPGASAKGGTGEADLAIGWFEREGVPHTPQVLCEFKDIRSALEVPQKRKNDTRTPVKQCLDYLGAARREMYGNEPILPTWAIATDMNEFRLYWFDRAPAQYIRFIIEPKDLFQGEGLLKENDAARFERFLFWRLFHRDTLLTTGGRCLLAQLIAQQWVRERDLENEFYKEYRAYRERLYLAMVAANPDFAGTKSRLVRLAQKILDRCIFIFFCEDMGGLIDYPPQLLRDYLIEESNSRYYDPKSDSIWQRLKQLFDAMNTGAAFGGEKLNQFNGGLFATDAELDSLTIPNELFCVAGQGQNEAGLYTYRQTLLYLSAAYNYATDWSQGNTPAPAFEDGGEPEQDPQNKLGLYTLGRIFEQSITELEILEAEADGRPLVNKESKRKRDGVYYTPEWVVETIVEQTLGRFLEEQKGACDWPDDGLPTVEQLNAYRDALKAVRVLDPACGSGAFLITALRFLMDEWRALEKLRRDLIRASQPKRRIVAREDGDLIADILLHNLYGVDINPASVEITQLALWLHTAAGDRQLSSLGHAIKCGNSLIDRGFYQGQIDLNLYDDEERERVNVFDWETEFPEVFADGGFDVVIGNPPYVKLQNFRKVHADMAEYLVEGRLGEPPFRSTQTGNFDLYLPFIEKGIALLKPGGRMGYIAPSLWTVNDYGAGLRDLIAEQRTLDRWVDFKSYQIFEKATTYTALQFFRKSECEVGKIAAAPDGLLADDPWEDPDSALAYDRFDFGDRWLLLSGAERALIDGLYARCKRLDDPAVTANIFVGLQTSADRIYHLARIGPGRYLCNPKDGDAYEVELEDAVMKPLVSGSEAKRYETPATDTYVLFPYAAENGTVTIISSEAFESQFPKAWAYLKVWEIELRKREADKDSEGEIRRHADGSAIKAPFDDEQWYRFGRHQNLDKQEIAKLLVPRMVSTLAVAADHDGQFYLDNVDVGGVAPAEGADIDFLAGVLNSPVTDFVFQRISKPFRGGYRSANRQFIAPLPIPPADAKQQSAVADLARSLQDVHTRRAENLRLIARRYENAPTRKRPLNFLLPDLPSADELEAKASKGLDSSARREWAKQQYELALTARYDTIGARLVPGTTLDAAFADGELSFSIDGMPVIDKVFVSEEDGAFIVAQWKVIAQTFSITAKTGGKKLCTTLRDLIVTDNAALRDQIIALQKDLETLESAIAEAETEMNELLYDLYGLTPSEIAMIEDDRRV